MIRAASDECISKINDRLRANDHFTVTLSGKEWLAVVERIAIERDVIREVKGIPVHTATFDVPVFGSDKLFFFDEESWTSICELLSMLDKATFRRKRKKNA